MSIVACIPARYNSSRFPGKPLAMILGKPMIQRVYEGVSKIKEIQRIVVLTDNDKIYDFCNNIGYDVQMTLSTHKTGSDRLYEFAKNNYFDYYLLVQGDEPIVPTKDIDNLINKSTNIKNYECLTLHKTIDSEEASSLKHTKLVFNVHHEVMYISRAKIPFNINIDNYTYNKHIGVFLYSHSGIEKFSNSPGYNELCEDIELLRVLENKGIVKSFKASETSISVDYVEDIKTVEKYLGSMK